MVHAKDAAVGTVRGRAVAGSKRNSSSSGVFRAAAAVARAAGATAMPEAACTAEKAAGGATAVTAGAAAQEEQQQEQQQEQQRNSKQLGEAKVLCWESKGCVSSRQVAHLHSWGHLCPGGWSHRDGGTGSRGGSRQQQ